MTIWLSTSNASDRANGALDGNRAVLCAALAVLVAIALYLVVSPEHVMSANDAASLAGP
jgi:hypothetical protein